MLKMARVMLVVGAVFLLLGPLSAQAAYQSLGKSEDAPSSDGDLLLPFGCIRQDTLAGSTSTDGDYANTKCNALGRLFTSATIDAALPTGSNTIGTVNLGTGGTGATSLGKAEDAAHVDADTGVMSLCVRKDTSTTGLGVNGDYAPCAVNASGHLYTVDDTELPAAATLADNTANPTVPGVAAFLMCFDDTTWDRCQPSVTDTDDNSVAFSQVTSLLLGLNHVSDGTSWVRTRTYLEDTGSAGGEQLGLLGAVRQDTPATSTSTDGDYTYLKTDSVSALWVNCRAGCSGGTQYPEDQAHNSGDIGTVALAKRTDAAAVSSGTDGDYATLNVDASGRLWVNCGTGCSGGTQYTEDAASAGGETLTLAGAVRQDTLSSSTSLDGDYAYLKVTAAGRLYTSATIDAALPAGTNNIGDVDVLTMPGTGTEDAAETAGGTLHMAGTVRRDTAAASSNGDGDNSTLNTDSLGLLWTRQLDPCSGVSKVAVPFSVSSATTTQLVAASASNKVYVCAINAVVSAADNVALVEDDTAACASPTAGLAGGTTAGTGWNFAANGGLTLGNGAGTIAVTAATNRYVCLITSSTAQLSGTVMYALAP